MIKRVNATFLAIFFLVFQSIITYDYDLIIIGGGISGLQAARTALEYDKKIAIIEKNDIASNHLFGDFAIKVLSRIGLIGYHVRSAYEAKICNTLTGLLNYNTVLPYICSIIAKIQQHALSNLLDDQRVEVVRGNAVFINKHTVKVGASELTSEKFIIATGTIQNQPPKIEGINSVNYLDERSFFCQKELPHSIIILGSDTLAVELACALANLGVKVTIIIKYGLLLPNFDYEMAELLNEFMEKVGIAIQYNTMVHAVEESENITVFGTDYYDTKMTFSADALFVAHNRKPNIDGLNLSAVGVAYSKEGIIVDSSLKTSVDTVYACGDVTSSSDQLTRIADYQAKIAGHNIFCSYWQHKMHADYTHASRIVFSTIPLASAGLTEQQAIKKYGNQLQIYKIPYSFIERAFIDNTTFGLGKFICDKRGRLVGAHILGECAGELIDTIAIGKNFSEQYMDYLFELRTPPSYFDLIWLATEQSRTRMPKKDSLFYSLLQKLNNCF